MIIMDKITLISGKELECYPKAEKPSKIQKDDFALDTTGEYLTVGKQRRKKKKSQLHDDEPWREPFFQNAFYLYEHRDAILSDSRMFLTPLPFKNHLAYTGTNGFNGATLGVYLEWWEAYDKAVLKDKDGTVCALTYFIAGSPLSGANRCSAINRDGKIVGVQFSPFIDAWRSFIAINKRYTKARQVYQAYTIEETIRKLKRRYKDDRPDEKVSFFRRLLQRLGLKKRSN